MNPTLESKLRLLVLKLLLAGITGDGFHRSPRPLVRQLHKLRLYLWLVLVRNPFVEKRCYFAWLFNLKYAPGGI